MNLKSKFRWFSKSGPPKPQSEQKHDRTNPVSPDTLRYRPTVITADRVGHVKDVLSSSTTDHKIDGTVHRSLTEGISNEPRQIDNDSMPMAALHADHHPEQSGEMIARDQQHFEHEDTFGKWLETTVVSKAHDTGQYEGLESHIINKDERGPIVDELTGREVVKETVRNEHKHIVKRHIERQRHSYIHEHIVQPIHDTEIVQEIQHAHDLPPQHKTCGSDNESRKIQYDDREVDTIVTENPHAYEELDPEISDVFQTHVIKVYHPIITRTKIIPHHHYHTQNLTEIRYEKPQFSNTVYRNPIELSEWRLMTQQFTKK